VDSDAYPLLAEYTRSLQFERRQDREVHRVISRYRDYATGFIPAVDLHRIIVRRADRIEAAFRKSAKDGKAVLWTIVRQEAADQAERERKDKVPVEGTISVYECVRRVAPEGLPPPPWVAREYYWMLRPPEAAGTTRDDFESWRRRWGFTDNDVAIATGTYEGTGKGREQAITAFNKRLRRKYGPALAPEQRPANRELRMLPSAAVAKLGWYQVNEPASFELIRLAYGFWLRWQVIGERLGMSAKAAERKAESLVAELCLARGQGSRGSTTVLSSVSGAGSSGRAGAEAVKPRLRLSIDYVGVVWSLGAQLGTPHDAGGPIQPCGCPFCGLRYSASIYRDSGQFICPTCGRQGWLPQVMADETGVSLGEVLTDLRSRGLAVGRGLTDGESEEGTLGAATPSGTSVFEMPRRHHAA
jgi:hypothetical protein